jgi:hypothetical protein
VEKKSLLQTDQISIKQSTDQKDIVVTADLGEYLPILGKKILDYYEKRNKVRQEDGSIHIFEITNCLRQSLILQQYPDEVRKLTIWDTKNFDHGLNSETVLVDILNSERDDKSSSTEYQYNIDFSGISGHPDYIEGDWVFELKSVNKFKPLILSNGSVTGYIKQVVYYMILMNIEKGRILVSYNMPFFPEKVSDIIEDENFPEIKTPLYKLNFHKESGQFPYFTCKVEIPLNAPIRQQVKDGLLNIVKPLYQEGDITKFPRLDGALDGSNYKCSQYCKARDKCFELADEQHDVEIKDILLNKHIERQTNKVKSIGRRGDRNVVI